MFAPDDGAVSVLPVGLRAEPPAAVLPGALWVAGDPLDYAWAAGAGIDVVVDLSDAGQRPDPAEIVAVDYRKYPLADHVLPAGDLIQQIVAAVVVDVREGRRVVVHCGTGTNRSAFVVALAVRELLGVSGIEAIATLRAARPGALTDRIFVDYLAGVAAPSAP